MDKQLVLAMEALAEEETSWIRVWDQVPEASRGAAVDQCARIVARAVAEAGRGDGEGDEERE